MTARSSLAARSAELSITSQNIANVNNQNYHRQTASVHTIVSDSGMGIYVKNAKRAASDSALDAVFKSQSVATASGSYGTLLNELESSVGKPFTTGISMSIGQLQGDLRTYSNEPSNMVMAQQVVNSVGSLANTIKQASADIQKTRMSADQSIELAVKNINKTLADIETINREIVRGTALGHDVNAKLDERDAMLKTLSSEMGIDVLYREKNDIAIYTDSGITLFETSAREVSFTPTGVFDGSTVANNVFVDGVTVAGPGARNPIKGGAIAGYAKMRDETAITMQKQVDELAFSLIDAFKETDPAGGGADAPGLFTWAGGTAMPTRPADVDNIAASIQVNDAYVGNLELVRDGATYDYNPDNNAAYADRLNTLVDSMKQSRTFDAAASVNTESDLMQFAANTASWFAAERKRGTETAALNSTAFRAANETLSGKTGVSIDKQMQLLLSIEKSYSASARLLTTIDGMFQTLLNAAR